MNNQIKFDTDTSLIKRVNEFPIVEYEGVINSGSLKVGNYTFYFKYCDYDGNETDIIAESGLVSIFKGNDGDPFSIDGGINDMNANKSILFTIKNIYKDYKFITVLYTRSSSEIDSGRVTSAYSITHKFPIKNNSCSIIITGAQETTQIPLSEINSSYFIVDNVKAQAQFYNMLFLGNITNYTQNQDDLMNISLRVIPYIKRQYAKQRIGYISTKDYKNDPKASKAFGEGDGIVQNASIHEFPNEYYNTKNIYYNVGYWNEEYYRLGIVYIYDNNKLSPVYNILGYDTKNLVFDSNEAADTFINKTFDFSNLNSDKCELDLSLEVDHQSNFIDYEMSDDICTNKTNLLKDKTVFTQPLNVRGIIHINDSELDKNGIAHEYLYNIGVYLDKSVIQVLQKRFGIKGFFIVRQKRIPTILCQAYSMPWDKEAKIPLIEYWDLRYDQYKNIKTRGGDWFKFYNGFLENGIYPQFRRCFVSESFMNQCALDSIGGFDPKTKEYFQTSKRHYIEDLAYSSGQAIINRYTSRLLEILPNCIDRKMCVYDFNISQPTIQQNNKFKVHLSSSQDQKTDAEGFLNTQYDSFDEAYSIYSDLDGSLIAYEEKLESNGDGTYKKTDDVTPKNKALADYIQFGDIKMENLPRDSEYEIQYAWANDSQEVLRVYDTLDQLLNDREFKVALKPPKYIIQYITVEGIDTISIVQEINKDFYTKLEEFHTKQGLLEKNDTGYINDDAYYFGAIVDRYYNNIKNSPKFTNGYGWDGRGGQERNYKFIKNYYSNRRFKGNFSNKGFDTKNRRMNEGVLKTDKSIYAPEEVPKTVHYNNLYKDCNGNQFTSICPESIVRQSFFNQLFTGSEYYTRYTPFQQGVLVRNESNPRLYYSETSNNLKKTINVKFINPDVDITYTSYITQDNVNNINKQYSDPYTKTIFLGEQPQTLNIDNKYEQFKIVQVTDNVPIVAIGNTIYKSVLGSDQEAFRYLYLNEENSPLRGFKINTSGKSDKIVYNHYENEDFNLARGIYSPYLGCEKVPKDDQDSTVRSIGYSKTYNIYNNTVLDTYVEAVNKRAIDYSEYYSISERISFYNIPKIPELYLDINSTTNDSIHYNLFRGDCFLCTYTHRLNRNFNDPTDPSNDKILDPYTWKLNYTDDTSSQDNVSKLNRINRGDINAVKLGSWITIKVRSTYNLSIRSLDSSHLQEAAEMGRERGFYPLQQASADGGYKIPNSYVINDVFGSTLGSKQYVSLNDDPYIKTNFTNRILYSDVNVTDSFQNNYRVFRGTHYRDYPKQYGQIVKLVSMQQGLLCILEHGITFLPIKERVLASEGAGGQVFINNNNVLPETMRIINDSIGSQWADSIIKTPYYVYGIDTTVKKIWRTNGDQVEIISDMKVSKFLTENIPAVEDDTSLIIGLKNIKSHYNASKSDVMFTLYYKPLDKIKYNNEPCKDPTINYSESTYKDDEYAWNLCYNELSQTFITFYSWIPLYSENINKTFYSFDREYAREILLHQELDTSNISENDLLYKDKKDKLSVVENSESDFPKERLHPYIWKHSKSSSKPCLWYDEQHPFEFEFVVNEHSDIHKIFTNLEIISNKAEPESFHYTTTGDVYKFDLANIYYRQEVTKKLYNGLGSNITFNSNYTLSEENLFQEPKSTIFPLYYDCINTKNDIYDTYTQMLDPCHSRDYKNLSGTEVLWNKALNQYYVSTHIKNSPIDGYWKRVHKKQYEEFNGKKKHTDFYYIWDPVGRLRGNSQYKENKWVVQIPSISYMQKNEKPWTVPDITILSSTIPEDLQTSDIKPEYLPNTYNIGQISIDGWTNRKETKIRDKYCKIRIRYTGNDIAIISAILTHFETSYA